MESSVEKRRRKKKSECFLSLSVYKRVCSVYSNLARARSRIDEKRIIVAMNVVGFDLIAFHFEIFLFSFFFLSFRKSFD